MPLIVDTDIGGGSCRDVDDVGAVCMANALADNGEVELLAVVVNTRPVQGVGAVSAINTWYGRNHVPIGAYRPPVPDDGLWPHPPIVPWIGTLPDGTSDPLPYVDKLVDDWPSCAQGQSAGASAVDVYRRVLATQPDHSVTISSIGVRACELRTGRSRVPTVVCQCGPPFRGSSGPCPGLSLMAHTVPYLALPRRQACSRTSRPCSSRAPTPTARWAAATSLLARCATDRLAGYLGLPLP